MLRVAGAGRGCGGDGGVVLLFCIPVLFRIYQVTNTLWQYQFMLNPGPFIQATFAHDYSGISVRLAGPITKLCMGDTIFSHLFSYLILKTDL